MPSNYNNLTFEWYGRAMFGDKIEAKCAICNSQLSTHKPPNGNDVEAFTILPCGHAFGYECVKTWFQRGHSAKCPSCGISAKHRGCGHMARLDKMQQEKETKTMTLMMVDEGGLRSRCDYCVYHNLGRTSKGTSKGASKKA